MEIMKESWIDSQPFPSWFSSIWAKRICKNAELHSSWYGARSSLRRCLKPFGVAGRWGFWVAISPRYQGFLTTTHVRNKSLKCGRSRDAGVPKNLPAIIFKASSQSQPLNHHEVSNAQPNHIYSWDSPLVVDDSPCYQPSASWCLPIVCHGSGFLGQILVPSGNLT